MYKGLGFIPGRADPKNENYPLSAITPTASTRKKKTWPNHRWHGDQAATSSCVGFHITHLFKDGPVLQGRNVPKPAQFAWEFYREAQKRDPWGPREADDGTTLNAAYSLAKERGFIESYRWAFSVEDVVQALLEIGPIGFGTIWYSNMSLPTSEGIMKPTGYPQGGHAYKADAVNLETGLIRIKNSWGKGWSKGGYAYISIEDVALLLSQRGEACLPIEVKK